MKRFGKFIVLALVLICVGVFGTALYGGLMAESAFTPEAKGATH